MPDARIRRIVILGGGTAGWMAAAALAKVNVPSQFELTLLESDDIGTVGVGEATIPTIHWFNQLVGVSDADLVREAQATFKLGIEFTDWQGDGRSYLHPFGRYGGPQDQSMFYHRWIRQQLRGRISEVESFSLTAQLARAGRFARPSADSKSSASTLGYAYHFDASLYARLLRRLAEAAGVRRVEGRVVDIAQHGENGFVAAVVTDRGDRVEGDFFLDCSGFRSLLLGQALQTPFEDWSHWLPCDRALAVPTASSGTPHPFTRAVAGPAGWRWRIPLQHRVGNGLVYCSSYLSDDEARAKLSAGVGEPFLADPRPLRFQAGIRAKVWNKNVLALGLASGFLEPLESTSIHFIQSGLAKFLSLFPSISCPPTVAEQFNRTFRADMESARDFLILHYLATTGRNEPFWRAVQAAPPPDSLTFRLDSFRQTGRIVLVPEELFKEASWFSVFMGQGVRPQDYNPLVDVWNMDADLQALEQTRRAIAESCARAPSHAMALSQLGVATR